MGHKYSTYGLVMRNRMILKSKFQPFATVGKIYGDFSCYSFYYSLRYVISVLFKEPYIVQPYLLDQ